MTARQDLFAQYGADENNANMYVECQYEFVRQADGRYNKVCIGAQILRQVPENYGAQHSEIVAQIAPADFFFAEQAAKENSRTNAHGQRELR